MNEQDLEKKLAQLKNIRPSEQLIDKIVLDHNQKVKGRASFGKLIFNQIYNLMKWKTAVPVTIVILLVIFFGATKFDVFNNNGDLGKLQDMSKELLPISETTGDVDGIVDTILTFSENEGILMSEEIADANLITADSQEIINFGQSYNENEF